VTTVYRNQLLFAGDGGNEGNIMVTWWSIIPEQPASIIAANVGALPIGLALAQRGGNPSRSGLPSGNLRYAARLDFNVGGGPPGTSVVVPAQPSWFLPDGEQVNGAAAGPAAVIAGFLAGGLCSPDGTVMTRWVGGVRVAAALAPWPIL
jgi:hypothetical protein